jgi:4'-phosphopantetheinyl transferase
VTTNQPRLVVAYGSPAAHEVLRAEAAQFLDVRREHIVLGHECPRCGSDLHGRPLLLATAAVRRPAHVSLSRAGDLSVVAVTDAGPLGVDVEADGAAGFAGFAGAALHPSERTTGNGDPTRTWVRKEAVLKAYGLGLAVDPRDIQVDGDRLVAWDSPHPAPSKVWFRDLDIPGHAAAVAVIPSDGTDLDGLTLTVHHVA